MWLIHIAAMCELSEVCTINEVWLCASNDALGKAMLCLQGHYDQPL